MRPSLPGPGGLLLGLKHPSDAHRGSGLWGVPFGDCPIPTICLQCIHVSPDSLQLPPRLLSPGTWTTVSVLVSHSTCFSPFSTGGQRDLFKAERSLISLA